MTDEPILVVEALQGGVERITMNRPARLNALNHPLARRCWRISNRGDGMRPCG